MNQFKEIEEKNIKIAEGKKLLKRLDKIGFSKENSFSIGQRENGILVRKKFKAKKKSLRTSRSSRKKNR